MTRIRNFERQLPTGYRMEIVGELKEQLKGPRQSLDVVVASIIAISRLPAAVAALMSLVDHPYQTQFQGFFDALDRGEDMPLTSFEDGLAAHRVIEAADRPAREGKPVKLADVGL